MAENFVVGFIDNVRRSMIESVKRKRENLHEIGLA